MPARSANRKRIVLILSNAAEASVKAKRLERSNYKVTCLTRADGDPLRALRDDVPDAIIVDMNRQPTFGHAAAVFLRQQKATRTVPLILVADKPSGFAKVRKQLPDAHYTNWSRIRGTLTQAINRPPTDPHVPGTMDAYSATPLPKKLGIKPGTTIAMLGAPDGFQEQLGDAVKGTRIRKQARGQSDLILLFVKSQSELNRRLPAAIRILADRGSIWLAWPKQSSGVQTDLTQKFIRNTGLAAGLVDYKIAAIDDTWSGLRFAIQS